SHHLYSLHSSPTRRSSDLSYNPISCTEMFAGSHLTPAVGDGWENPSDLRLACHKDGNLKSFCSPFFRDFRPLTPHSRMPRSFLRSEEHTSAVQSRFDLVCR